MRFKITFIWDEGMWYTKCEELGLTLESGSFDALVERVKIAVPEMAELNLGYKGEIQLDFAVERSEKLRMLA